MKRTTWYKPPKPKYSSLEDISKFNMLWTVSLGLAFIFLVLLFIHLFFDDQNWATSLAAMAVAMVNLIVLRQLRSFKLVGVWSILLGTFICQSSIFLVIDSHVISDTMWCILIGFFTFFLFGIIPGIIVLLSNLGGLLTFLMLSDPESLSVKGLTNEQVGFQMVINVCYVALAISYIIHRIIKSNRDMVELHEQQLKQNEVLLKEIHHRVKNNLQIISSLLKLQAFESNNELVQKQFSEAIGRIRSMALIHEKMYSNHNFNAINLKSYLETLVGDISNGFGLKCAQDIQIDKELSEIDIKGVVPISLIFNELITNSAKHAFNEDVKGEIQIHIEKAGSDVIIYYSDNGVWKSISKEGGFGLELINAMVEQLEGSFEKTTNEGTSYRFKIPFNQLFFRVDAD